MTSYPWHPTEFDKVPKGKCVHSEHEYRNTHAYTYTVCKSCGVVLDKEMAEDYRIKTALKAAGKEPKT